MKNMNRIVPVSVCLVSSLLLTGCDQTSPSTTTQVKPASQQAPVTPPAAALETAAVEKPATPAVAAPDATASKADQKAAAATATELAPPGVTPATPPPQQPISTVQIVKAEHSELDLGDIPTNDSKSGKVKLINTGDKPMTIQSARASCGCTALKFQPNTVIQPQEEIEVELQMTGGPRPGPVAGKTVTFVVEGQPEVVVQLKGQAVSFVVSDPSALDPETMPEGKFTLKSIDGQPFRIMSTQPAVVGLTEKEPKTEHELNVDWAKYREIGVNRQLIVYLDHPKCQTVFMQVNFKPEELADANRKIQQQAQTNKGAIADPLERSIAVEAAAPAVDPDTILADLIKQGRNAEVLAKLQSGLDPNYRNAAGTPLLSMAAEAGNTDLVKALLATEKVDLNSTDNNGRTPLIYAATSNNVETLQALLDKGANPSTRDSLGATALWWAAMRGNAANVVELIDAGSDVEVVGTITGWTPLIVAAGFGDPGAIEPLVKAHAKLEAQDMLEGATPLIYAAMTGKLEAVKILLKNGANIENPDRNGNTPFLACAKASGGEADKLKLLIEAGANIRAKDNRGFNALQLARKRTDIRAPEVLAVLEPLLGSETPASESASAPVPPTAPATAPVSGDGHKHAPGETHDHD